jgi:hypothetical protein
VFCAGGVAGGSGAGYVVQVALESVPGEGAGLLGIDLIVSATLAAGAAAAANGAQLTVTVLFEIGGGRAAGIAETVTASLSTAGTATGGVGISGPGVIAEIRAILNPGFAFAGLSRVFNVTSKVVTKSAVSTGAVDASFSDVSLLLHMDGSNNSTTFTDNSANAFTVTASGGAKISTAQSVFGGASGLFDGNGDYLSCVFASELDLIGSSFTVEAWVRLAATPSASGMRVAAAGGGVASFNSTNGIHWWLGIDPSMAAGAQIRTSSGAFTILSSAILSLSTWSHVALSVDGSNVYIAVDGIVTTAVISSIQRPSTNPVFTVATINGESGASSTAFNGYIDDLRVTKAARTSYQSNFTPPNAAHPNA